VLYFRYIQLDILCQISSWVYISRVQEIGPTWKSKLGCHWYVELLIKL
jgi:hypothetical protein